MLSIEANTPFEDYKTPIWAILQRELIRLMDDAYKPVMERYVRKDGSLLWPPNADHTGIDALDDAYESFHNWPLFYLLGGADSYLELSLQEYDAITQQFTRYDSGHGHPMVVKDYEQGYDWFHQGEGYLFFYYLNLAAPNHPVNRERSLRYAGFYLNEDPDAQNYDAEHRLIKCAHTGSMGPAYRNFTGEPWVYEEWKSFYGLPFMDVPGCRTIEDIKEPAAAAAMGAAMRERMSHGDVVVNLAATSMVANAYLHTGEEKYKQWLEDYVGAWVERMEQSGGIIPDNVGLSGIIGETTGGKWYGSYYGWTWPHGWLSVGDSVTIAAENASLILRDSSYLELLRSQLDLLIRNGFESKGTHRVPYKYGDPGSYHYKLWIEGVQLEEDGEVTWRNGWFEFQPMDIKYPVHLWNMSAKDEDRHRIRLLRNGDKRDWEQVIWKTTKDSGGHDAAWEAYLTGEFPDYPEKILNHNMAQVHKRMQFIREDQQDPSTYTDSYLQARNPITVEALLQLTMGAPLPIYNGGLLMARLRYFDADRRRSGLPLDVAALVETVEAERVVVWLVNLSSTHIRRCIVQAGAFGEHTFNWIRHADASIPLDADANEGKRFLVRLLPGCQIKLELGMQRFANEPSYEVVWNED